MTIQDLGSIGELIAAIATIATLVYLAIQIRQNTAQQKLDAYVSVQHGQNSAVDLLRDPELMRAYALTAEYGRDAAPEDRSRAINFVLQYLNHFQIVHDLYVDGIIKDERYELWKGFAVAVVAPPGILDWWHRESGRMAFMPEVRTLIEDRLEDHENPPVPISEMWSIHNASSWE